MVLFKTLGGSGPPDPHLRHAHGVHATEAWRGMRLVCFIQLNLFKIKSGCSLIDFDEIFFSIVSSEFTELLSFGSNFKKMQKIPKNFHFSPNN